ncbi:hypothetical protein B0H14DRAFT_3142290 [Mycena olivaceomarginata]|nr:hypothetical protein B0H14DRAFT_3142290 [Mycena olivaceomarginata]
MSSAPFSSSSHVVPRYCANRQGSVRRRESKLKGQKVPARRRVEEQLMGGSERKSVIDYYKCDSMCPRRSGVISALHFHSPTVNHGDHHRSDWVTETGGAGGFRFLSIRIRHAEIAEHGGGRQFPKLNRQEAHTDNGDIGVGLEAWRNMRLGCGHFSPEMEQRARKPRCPIRMPEMPEILENVDGPKVPTGYGSAQALSTGLGTTGVGLVVPAFLVGSSTPRRDRRAWWQVAKLSGQEVHTSGYLQGRVSFEA